MEISLKHILNLVALFAVVSCTTSSGDNFFEYSSGNKTRNSQIYTINSTGGVYKVGNPYQIFGTWYYPKEDYKYSETGISSWYGDGDGFHAKTTANGEKYDMNTLTAAHRTLPLPSIVKVTNLENGRTVILRVNDRGPYAKNRIIDISRKGAEILGFKAKGTAKVKVEIMPEESKKLKAAMLNKRGGDAWVKANKYQTPAKSEPAKPTAKTSIKEKSAEYAPKFVQAGSFSSYESADNLKKQLSKFGKTFITSATVDGSKYYRVRLGPYRYDDEAALALEKIKDYGIYNAKIVSN